MMIIGLHGQDVEAWSADIETALVNIRAKIQSGVIVALQALVGAPTHAVGNKCFTSQG
ncbi:MAG: hypothetical protein ACO2YY_07555 [Pseudohongiellaceae bacterium]